MSPVAGQSPDSGDKICIDRKTLKQLLVLACRSTDILVNIRHREIFLDSLDTYLSEATEFDADDCFRASLLLESYYEYVSPSLAQLGDILDEAFELIQAVEHD
ncbi:MAG: hypothetical protein JGK30_22960 [Microcoleus sp. PH2017_40_RAT_O_B]|uniref:hypothetical protein n=1 Tax=unclassified Microcoleus TaxID=2642155 RepID=UPI001D2EA272|nr:MULTISPECIES: hypothetical protein [unclassified Microcoleus]MCC3573592.1 hypothetical protein [Microcoleus sp. PH2017_34_RAT_O_A]MCC3612255.1 hypothetical protein [Microcoleus sp. PH2017_40_RAT_O_B]